MTCIICIQCLTTLIIIIVKIFLRSIGVGNILSADTGAMYIYIRSRKLESTINRLEVIKYIFFILVIIEWLDDPNLRACESEEGVLPVMRICISVENIVTSTRCYSIVRIIPGINFKAAYFQADTTSFLRDRPGSCRACMRARMTRIVIRMKAAGHPFIIYCSSGIWLDVIYVMYVITCCPDQRRIGLCTILRAYR